MTRQEEIINAANEYVTKTHSPSTNEFQTAINIAVVKAYIAAAKYADETIIDKACEWIEDNVENAFVNVNGVMIELHGIELSQNIHKVMEE